MSTPGLFLTQIFGKKTQTQDKKTLKTQGNSDFICHWQNVRNFGPIFEQNVTINFEPIFEQNADKNSYLFFEKI